MDDNNDIRNELSKLESLCTILLECIFYIDNIKEKDMYNFITIIIEKINSIKNCFPEIDI